MRRKSISALLLILSYLVACAGPMKELDANPPYSPHQYRYYDLELDWKSERTDDLVRIEGKLSNLRYYFLRDLELTASLLDEKGKVVARESVTAFPTYLRTNETVPFRLELRLKPGQALRRIRFSYTYQLADTYQSNGYRRDDVPHFNSFESEL